MMVAIRRVHGNSVRPGPEGLLPANGELVSTVMVLLVGIIENHRNEIRNVQTSS
jgi:hypothetical protein